MVPWFILTFIAGMLAGFFLAAWLVFDGLDT